MNKGMKKHVMRAAACFVTGSMLAGSSSMAAFAAGTNLVGVSTTANVKEAAAEDTQKTEEIESTTEGTASEENTESAEAAQDSSLIGTVAVAQPGDETFFNIRANADANSDVVGYLYENNCATILGEEGDWYQVKVDDKEGYVVKKYITDSKEEAEVAAKAKQDAEEAAAAQQAAEAAAQQAAEQAAQQASQSAGSTAGGKTEVSRQAYDDCDGSGHGYYEITYSDGSTAIEEY